jgi:RNA polymerase-binding transcription factor DksA
MAPVETGAILAFRAAHAAEGASQRKEIAMSSAERTCHRCGKKIPQRRLEVLPHTRLCIDCSREVGGDFETYVVPENTGKPGSLKKNYGSWNIKRKLREISPKQAK